MKNKSVALSLMCILLMLSYNSYSQSSKNSTKEIKNLITKKRSFNNKYGFGYRIQLYNGNEEEARKHRERFKIEFPDTVSNLVYNTPEWKVQVGNYKTKLEADKDLLKFKEEFSGIIVIPMGK